MKLASENEVLGAARVVAELNSSFLGARRAGLVPSAAAVACRDEYVEAIRAFDRASGRQGEWFFSASGRRFWPFDPRPEDVHLEDIAHALSLQCRFCGNVSAFLSVGQHSVMVSRICAPYAALAGLLHDASEAYLGDVIRPIKKLLPTYEAIEDGVMRAVCVRFGLGADDEALWREVKRADNVALSTEMRDLARAGGKLTEPAEPPMDERIVESWSPEVAKRRFLERFHELSPVLPALPPTTRPAGRATH